jgi:hypothetical protein
VGRKGKVAPGVTVIVGLLAVTVYMTGALMLFFVPYKTSIVRIADADLASWKGQVRTIAHDRRGWFREKELQGHWGGGDSANRFAWRQFGYCNFSECLVLTNHFEPTEFYIVIYENRLLGGGTTLQSYLEGKRFGHNWE